MAQGESLTLRERLFDKSIAMSIYILPLIEMIISFGFSCLNTILPLSQLTQPALAPILNFWQTTPISIIVFLMAYFLVIRPTLSFRRFVRFNVAQGLLLYLMSTLVCFLYSVMPTILKQSFLGFMIESVFYLAIVGASLYSMISVSLGVYSDIPFISEAADLHVQPSR